MIKIFGVLAFLILIFPLINADIITPGYSPIEVNNYITNINEFPNYVFISGPDEGVAMGLGMCPPQIVEESGQISSSYYKFCSISVFALEKDKVNYEILDNLLNREFTDSMNHTEEEEYYGNFLNSTNAKKVIENIEHYKTMPDSSTIKEINNYYTIDLNQVKTAPNKKENGSSYLTYIYIISSLISLWIILLILIKRKGSKK